MFTKLHEYQEEIGENRFVLVTNKGRNYTRTGKTGKSYRGTSTPSSGSSKGSTGSSSKSSGSSSNSSSGSSSSSSSKVQYPNASAATKASAKEAVKNGYISQSKYNSLYGSSSSSSSSSGSTSGSSSKSIGGVTYRDTGSGYKATFTVNGQTVLVTEQEVSEAGSVAKAAQGKLNNDTRTDQEIQQEEEEIALLEEEEDQFQEDDPDAFAKILEESYAIIDAAFKKGDITQAQADAYKKIAKNWDPDKLMNTENILRDYQKVASETIDPYWQQQLNFEIGVLQESVKQQQVQQQMENEQLNTLSGENIRQTKAGLEKSGMTFTGKGIEQLGAGSAFSQDGSSIPSQTPFGGLFNEGTVNQANRLMKSSSLAKYSDALTNLGQNAEQRFGSKKIDGLIPGYTPTTNNLEGDINTQWNEAKGNAWVQQMNNWNSKNAVNSNIVNI